MDAWGSDSTEVYLSRATDMTTDTHLVKAFDAFS